MTAPFPLPHPPETANVEQLAALMRERFTGLTTTAVTLSDNAVEGYELVFKNGALLDPSVAYTISANAITLSVAAIAGDVFVIWYYRRGT